MCRVTQLPWHAISNIVLFTSIAPCSHHHHLSVFFCWGCVVTTSSRTEPVTHTSAWECNPKPTRKTSSQWSVLSLHLSRQIIHFDPTKKFETCSSEIDLYFIFQVMMTWVQMIKNKIIFEPLPAVISASLLCVCFRRDCLHCTCRDCEDDQKAASLQAPPLSSTSPPLLLSLHHSSTYPKRQSQTGRLPSHQIHLDFH